MQTFAGAGTPRNTEHDAQTSISQQQAAQQILHAVNAARRKAGVPPLRLDPALMTAAHNLLPDPKAENLELQHDLMQALPANARDDFSSLQTLAGACGGCGVKPSAADVDYFAGDWLKGKYRDSLLAKRFGALGFAMTANGEGKKVAVLVLGDRR